MRALLQRVSYASVVVDGEEVGRVGAGLMVLVGVGQGDEQSDIEVLARKLVNLRIFEDEQGKMNLSLLDTGGEALLVSQFTLYADCRKGRRPSFGPAMPPAEASEMFDRFVEEVRGLGVSVQTGRFGAMMDVSLCNQGPVTIMLETQGGAMVSGVSAG